MSVQHWYQKAVYYEVSVQAFFDGNNDGVGDLAGLTSKLEYLAALGVDCLWLLPIYPSPMKDDGYDIQDYCSIRPNLGTLDEFKTLIAEAHRQNLKIILDLVMNHTSDEHPWFKSARMDRHSPFHDYYVWSETDQKYADAGIIFVDVEKSNWSWNEATGEYYWHRFYACQPDLNYDNPKVKAEIFNVVKFWLDLGIDGFRVDAVPYLIERDGTLCENLPETHAILKELRQFVSDNYSEKVLICEANLAPWDVRQYMGEGDEFHIAFNFPLMPRLFLALRKEDAGQIRNTIEQLPAIPEGCQWGTFLRNHDELTLALLNEEERQYMWKEYAGDTRYYSNIGIRKRLAHLLENDQRRIALAYSLLFSLPGAPFIYYGDEIGMGDNVELFDRNGLRTPMQWMNSRNGGFSQADQLFAPIVDHPAVDTTRVNVADQMARQDSLWHVLRDMIRIRKNQRAFSCQDIEWLETTFPQVAMYIRGTGEEKVLAVHNLGNQTVTLKVSHDFFCIAELHDLISGKPISCSKGECSLTLAPYQYLWLTKTN